ncbi:MAG: Gfo/Idh/MocA family protein [Candidatus Thorarchaeota archaeon]
MKDLKVLVVGCGSIGERHLRNLFTLGLSDILICDANRSRIKEITQKYNVTAHHDLEEAIRARPILSLVCTPNHSHLPIALKLTQADSHLFIEKPLSDRLEGVDELVATVEKKQLVCLVGCNMRFSPAIARLIAKVEGGEIGRVLSIRAHYGHYLPNWRPQADYRKTYSSQRDQGGGIILDAIHEIDYVSHLGGQPVEVFCYAQKVSNLQIDVEDTADILIRFKDGVQASIHVDYLDQVKRRSCEIVGSEGTLIWRSLRKQPEEVTFEHHRNNKVCTVDRFDIDPNAMYLAELEHLLECVVDGVKPALGVRGAYMVLKLALAANKSARKHETVVMG